MDISEQDRLRQFSELSCTVTASGPAAWSTSNNPKGRARLTKFLRSWNFFQREWRPLAFRNCMSLLPMFFLLGRFGPIPVFTDLHDVADVMFRFRACSLDLRLA